MRNSQVISASAEIR